MMRLVRLQLGEVLDLMDVISYGKPWYGCLKNMCRQDGGSEE
jgi:hypothetical protein